jgi:large subunit ribosomal protein L20
MPRSVNSVASRARRKKVLKQTKGYFGRGKNVFRLANNKLEKGLQYAYRDRKAKKRHFRSLWIMRINAAVREYGMSYSQFMGLFAKSGIVLNRKVLADLALHQPAAFKAIVDKVKATA